MTNNSIIFYLDINTGIYGAVTITLSTNANYINAIYSKHDVNFNKVTYWDGGSLVTKNDPIKSQYVAMQNVILEIYDQNNNLINISDKTNLDGQVILNYLNFTRGCYNLKVYVPENDYIPYLSGDCDLTVHPYGDFDLLQMLIMSGERNGIVTLSRDYIYDLENDTIKEGIIINRPITIDGNGYTIDAQGKSRIFKILADNVKIRNLNLINSSSINEGGAINCKGDNLDVSLCNFEYNAAYKGAAIYLNGLNGVIRFCAFLNNSAEKSGGAIFWEGYNVNIDSCAFENNYADYSGGALNLDCTGNISYCGFNNNRAGYGGAIELTIKSGLESYCNIADSSFDKNSAETGGGSIYVSGGSNLNIYNGIFNNNTAMVGGVLAITDSINGHLNHCTFKDNAASKNGGVIYAIGADHGLLNDCYFTNNSGDLGGAIYWRASYSAFNDCIFEYNAAMDRGGAIFATGFNNVINTTVFKHNSADDAGAVYCEYHNSILNGCIFEYNVASNAGALHWVGDYTILKNSIFENNAVNNSGGAVFWSCRSSLLDNCSFANNTADSLGGAVYIGYVREGIASKNIVNESTFKYNSANCGGAIYWDSDGSRLDDSVFEYNVAGDKGGAIYYKKFAIISDSVFLNNKANLTNFELNVTSNINVSFSGNENYINALYSEYGVL